MLSAITKGVIDEGTPSPPSGGSEQKVSGVAAEDPVVCPGSAPRARVEDLVGEVGGGEACSQARCPRVNGPVACEEPNENDF